MGGTWSRCRGERHGCRRRRRSWQRTGSRASAWIRFAEQPAARRYLSAPAAYVGALLSKSVTLPAALLIWHWWKRGRVTWTDLLRIAPFFAVGGAIAVADVLFSRSSNAR